MPVREPARALRLGIVVSLLLGGAGIARAEDPPPGAEPVEEVPLPRVPVDPPPPPAGDVSAGAAVVVPPPPVPVAPPSTTARKGNPAPDVRPRPPEPPPPGVAVPGWDVAHTDESLPLPPPLPPPDPFAPRPLQLRHDRVVSADGRVKEVRRVPQWVDVIDRAAIEEYRPQEIGELLRRLPNVVIADGGSPFLAMPRIRGLGGDRVRILTDGIWPDTQALGVAGGTLSLWDPESVERVEVYHGPGAYLRGADSTGGFINIVPRRPHRHACPSAFGQIASGYNSADNRFRERITIDAGQDRVAAIFGLTYDDWGDRETADGTLDPSSWNRFAADLAADYFLDNTSTIGITAQWVKAQDVRSPLGDAFEHPEYERRLFAVTFASDAMGPIFRGTRMSIALDSFFLADEAEASSSPTSGIGSEDEATRFDFSLEGNLYVLPCHETWAELSFGYAHLERTERILCADVVGPVPEASLFGQYLRESGAVTTLAEPGVCVEAVSSFEATELRLKALVEDEWHDACWDFHVGARVDYVHVEDDRTGEEDSSFLFAVAGGVARHLTPCTTLFANASFGQRHPSLAERLQVTILDGITVFPNEDLENETSVNVEVGVKQSYFNRFTFQGAVFGHWLGDYIGRRFVGPDQVWDNFDDVLLYGAETSASWRPDPCRCEGLELFGTAGITLSSDEDVIDDVPVHGRAGARWSQCVAAPCGIRRWFVEGAVRGAAESDAFDGSGGDAFVTSEIFAGVGWASGGRRNAFLTVGVTNLLDEDYVELGSRLPSQGRSFQASLQFDF